MDIVNRLNHFLRQADISKSQFADSCGIPRPTASQILSGRNKKISDEIIAKIHSVYPNLSIMWLMFGEGSITVDPNEPLHNQSTVSEAPENSIFDTLLDEGRNYQKEKASFFGVNKNKDAIDDNDLHTKHIIKIVVFYSDNSFEEIYKH